MAFWQPNVGSWQVLTTQGSLYFNVTLIDPSDGSSHYLALTFYTSAGSPLVGTAYGNGTADYSFYVSSNDFEFARQVEFALQTSGTKQVSVYNFEQGQPGSGSWSMPIDQVWISSAPQQGLTAFAAPIVFPPEAAVTKELQPAIAAHRKYYQLRGGRG
jgi:hypothetical protein